MGVGETLGAALTPKCKHQFVICAGELMSLCRSSPNMRVQRTHRQRVPKLRFGVDPDRPIQVFSGTGRSLRSLGAPLTRRPFGDSRER